MSQYGWTNCLNVVCTQVSMFLEALKTNLGDNLVGVYLHGSLAMGCFNPERSDIDILVITMHSMTVETKRTIAEILLRSSMAPFPIEISLIVEQDIRPFQHPLPFDMHYSERWREKYHDELAHGEWMKWNNETGHDLDLTAHLMVTLKRGISLYGKSIQDAIPAIPGQFYSASILEDYKDARAARLKMPVYFVLNACRVYAYLQEGSIFSKDEGGAWALRMLPQELCGIVEQALDIYRGDRKDEHLDRVALTRLAKFMDEGIKKQRIL